MAEAIAGVKTQFGRHRSMTLAGGRTPTGPELIARDPSQPDRVLGRIQTCSIQDIEIALPASLFSLPRWRAVPIDGRVTIMTAAAALMRRRRFELAAWEIFETGKPWREADADVAEAIDFLEFYARDMVGQQSIEKGRRDPPLHKFRIRENPAVQRQSSLNPFDHELVQRPAHEPSARRCSE